MLLRCGARLIEHRCDNRPAVIERAEIMDLRRRGSGNAELNRFGASGDQQRAIPDLPAASIITVLCFTSIEDARVPSIRSR